MCIAFVYVNPKAKANEWKIVFINNRDEFYDRPTTQAAWYEHGSNQRVLYGRDGKAGGTWLTVDDTGRIGVLFSVTENDEVTKQDAPTRGFVVVDWHNQDTFVSSADYLEQIRDDGAKKRMNGFLALLLDCSNEDNFEMSYYCNRTKENVVESLPPGIYGFGNSPRNRPLRKVQDGVQRFQEVLLNHMVALPENRDHFLEDLLEILKDKTRHVPDPVLKALRPGVGDDWLNHLSSRFAEYPVDMRYGTRSHTMYVVDGNNQATYVEHSMVNVPKDPSLAKWTTKRFDFELKKSPTGLP